MKKVLLWIILLYQGFCSVVLKQILGVGTMCRFSPTCSEYAKRSVEKHGVLKGVRLACIRVARCQPFTKIVLS